MTGAAADWERLLMEAGVPAGRVRTIPEAVAEPQTASRDMLHKVFSTDLGHDLFLPGAAFELNGANFCPTIAPRCAGTDSAAILGELGYDGDRIAELARRGLVATGGQLR